MRLLFALTFAVSACGAVEDAADKINPSVKVSRGTYQGRNVWVVKCLELDVCLRAAEETCGENFSWEEVEKESLIGWWKHRLIVDCN